MHFIEAVAAGNVAAFGRPEHVIETLLSRVFFFPDQVIKVYKHQEAFYGNLADPGFRKEFYTEDFFWNHIMSPDIYRHLGGVQEQDQSFVLTEIETASDYYIAMAKIDSSRNLTTLLTTNQVSVGEMEHITDTLVTKLRSLTSQRRAKMAHVFAAREQKLRTAELEDLRNWMYLADAHIPRADADAIITSLQNKIRQESYFTQYDSQNLSIAIDTNCDNILLLNGHPSFIDIMPPKEIWRVNDELAIITRTAVDAYVLGNKALGDTVYSTYSNYRAPVSRSVQLICEIHSGLTQWAYRHLIGQDSLAEKYKQFVLSRVEQL